MFTLDTFDSKQMNWAALANSCSPCSRHRWTGSGASSDTVDLDMNQFAWALLPAVALLVLWELGKFVVRRAAKA